MFLGTEYTFFVYANLILGKSVDVQMYFFFQSIIHFACTMYYLQYLYVFAAHFLPILKRNVVKQRKRKSQGVLEGT